MLASVAEKLAGRDMSIESVETQLRMHGDHREFVVDVYASSRNTSDKDNVVSIVKDISQIKEDLGLDILNIRVQGVNKKELR